MEEDIIQRTIAAVNEMDLMTKSRYYLVYFINDLYWNLSSDHYRKYPHKLLSLEEFINKENIETRDAGEKWKERGFPQRTWINFSCPSIYHYVMQEIEPLPVTEQK